jgi:hypothetical protein
MSHNSDLAASSDSDDDCSDPEFDPDGEVIDDDDEEYDPPPFSYDVDVVFPDTDQCKSAVTHHAILNDHAYETMKKDKTRFRAKCKRANEDFKWKFCMYKSEVHWLQGNFQYQFLSFSAAMSVIFSSIFCHCQQQFLSFSAAISVIVG